MYILLYSYPFNHIFVLNPGMYTVYCTVYVHLYSQLLPLQLYTCTGSRYVYCTVYTEQFMYIYILLYTLPTSTIYLYWVQLCTLYTLQCTVHVHIYSLYCILFTIYLFLTKVCVCYVYCEFLNFCTIM